MKSVIIAIILFTLLIILLIANSLYIHKTCDKMLNILSSLTSTDIIGAEKLCSLWQKHRALFSISIHDSHIEKINELTEELKSAVEKADGAEFKEHIFLLSQIFNELKEIEEISFEGII